MPRGNGTGPAGMGPGTGMGRGGCTPGAGMGLGRGKGGGTGWWPLVTGGVAVASYLFDYFSKKKKKPLTPTVTPEVERKQLESQLVELKQQMNAIESRLRELGNK